MSICANLFRTDRSFHPALWLMDDLDAWQICETSKPYLIARQPEDARPYLTDSRT